MTRKNRIFVLMGLVLGMALTVVAESPATTRDEIERPRATLESPRREARDVYEPHGRISAKPEDEQAPRGRK